MSSQRGDHPRLRGDYGVQLSEELCAVRITPAYAGTTITDKGQTGSLLDHPRLRGDYAEDELTPGDVHGSPPPTRGLHQPVTRPPLIGGITPAYAGTTLKVMK